MNMGHLEVTAFLRINFVSRPCDVHPRKRNPSRLGGVVLCCGICPGVLAAKSPVGQVTMATLFFDPRGQPGDR